jgi:hypothetical protein
MSNYFLPMDLLRQEFPDYLEVGKVYHWPNVPGGEWEETSWHNNVCPSWQLETACGIYISLHVDYPEIADRELDEDNRWYIQLFNSDLEFICQAYASNFMGGDEEKGICSVQAELEHLLTSLGGAACR